MYHEVGLDALSKKQVSKLLNGHPVRVKFGSGVKALVSAEHLKKLTKAGMKGCGITVSLDPYAIAKNQHLRKAVGMLGRGTGHNVAKALGNAAIAGTDAASARLVRALEGSGLYGRGTGHNVAKALGNAAIAATDASAARLVRALEGSGIGHKKHGRPRKMAGGDGRGYGQAREQDAIRRSYPPTPSMSGRGKKSSTEQFRDWTKNIGQVFKPLNRGALGAAKRQVIGAAGNAISDEISNQGNPYIDGAELFSQGMAGMDGNPSTQGINLGSDVPVQQTRYQMRKAKIAARPYGQEPVYATPIFDNQNYADQTYASPDVSKSLGLPPLPSGAYEDSYAIPIGQLYGSGLKKRGRGINSNVNKVVGLVSMAEKAMGRGLKKMPKHLRPKRVMSEAQKAALAKGRHNLRLKLESMGAGVKKHRKTPKHRKGGALMPAGGALRAAGY